MIDHLLGRPSPSWKRAQVFLVIFFWIWRLAYANPGPPRVLWLRKVNRKLQRFSPWQIIVTTLTTVYAFKNLDKIVGLGSPEPLAQLYSPSYYRATWIATGLDAGFATAMSIRPKWLKDICSILFSIYYIIYANEADEKLRRFRAVPTVEMFRNTWEKTANPYLRLIAQSPIMSLHRKFLLPRPTTSAYDRPITVHIYFAPPAPQLHHTTDLILDFPGGGFVAMSPDHHDERLRTWALKTGKPVLAVDYGKAPECNTSLAVHLTRCLSKRSLLQTLIRSQWTSVLIFTAFSRKRPVDVLACLSCTALLASRSYTCITLNSGATLVVGVMVKILQYNATLPTGEARLPSPLSLVLNYAALDFNFTSWMSPDNLRVLRTEQSTGDLPGMRELALQKNHLQHISPLSMVGDQRHANQTFEEAQELERCTARSGGKVPYDDHESWADSESEEGEMNPVREEDRPIEEREQLSAAVAQANLKATTLVTGSHNGKGIGKNREPIGTRLTMTSRTGYFQDRIISPSMMRAMAILYIGPHRNPDFATDYFISPILTPSSFLAQFPPLLMQCGERDPFVDDTVIFAGRVREAKRARKAELDLVLTGKSAKFGEGLRMTDVHSDNVGEDDSDVARLIAERDQLARETEDDWVQMVLFSDWSHGYLQMMTLMREAKAVVEDLADWIEDAFVRHASKEERTNKVLEAMDAGRTKKKRETMRNSSQASRSPTKRPVCYAPSTENSDVDGNGKVDASPFASGTETDDSGITFVARKRGGSGIESRRSSNERPDVIEMKQGHSSPSLLGEGERESASGTPRAGNGKTGQRITETELMRRRRLLDAHIFEGQCT
ncbi:hypothetical protein J3R82DRAFT_10256 [Butyriboletus roseoflavus]|nr:hypothetical protein J3R82DRAFT_10256 [Butyriboletus roseoflavus]